MHIIEKHSRKHGHDHIYAAVVGHISGIVGREKETDSQKLLKIKETLQTLKKIEEKDDSPVGVD